MKRLSLIVLFLLAFQAQAQVGVNRLLAAGLEDAERFSAAYINPAADAVAFSMARGWYNTAKTKGLGSFELNIIGNMAFVPSNKQRFELNPADYNFLTFENGNSPQNVATALGENNPSIIAMVESNGEEFTFPLPQGIASEGFDYVPSAALQLSVGFVAGTEFKFRYTPEVNTDDVKVQTWGIGIQNEFTSWIPGADLLPVHIAGAVNYSRFNGDLSLEENNIVEGQNQFIDSSLDAWSVNAIVSTKLPIINFYAGFGYISARSSNKLKGTYRIQEGVLINQTVTDPISISSSISGFSGTLGTRLKLSFFRIHVDYSIQKFNTLSAGVSFGI
ncbi:MAG: DUF6588 family protein [Bacteroidota bacterium]